LASEQSKWLAIVDTPGVQRYIFFTDRLKEIVRASALLEDINVEETEKCVRSVKGETIYFGGGGGMALFPDEQAVLAFEGALRKLYSKKAPGLGLKLEAIPVNPEGSFGAHRRMLQHRLAGAPTEPVALVHEPVMRICESCGRHPAKLRRIIFKDADSGEQESSLLCRICDSKRDPKNKADYFHDFVDFLHKQGEANQLSKPWQEFLESTPDPAGELLEKVPNDLNELGQLCQARPGYVGMIYADGNNMSQALDKLDPNETWDDGAVHRTRGFSATLLKAMKHSVFRAFLELPPPSSKDNLFPALMLFLGGDDVTLACPADRALDLGLHIAKNFEREMQDVGMSLSVGVALSQSGLPTHILLNHAKQVLSSAKHRAFWLEAMGRKEGVLPEFMGAIDFSVVPAALVEDLQETRKRDWRVADAALTGRPYSLAEMDALIADLDTLRRRISLSRLYDLAAACQESPAKGAMAFYKLVARASEKEAKALLKVFNCLAKPEQAVWQEPSPPVRPRSYTKLLDLLELYSFLKPAGKEGDRDHAAA